MGYVPDDQVWNYFNEAKLVVLPYKKIYQSGVLLMVLSFGRAVLASNLPAFTEIVQSGENGFLFQAGDPHALANMIAHIMSNPFLLQTVEENGYHTVKKNFDWSEIGAATKKIYSEMLST